MAIVSLLNQLSRTGTVTTGSFNVPANVTGRYWLRTNMAAGNLTNTAFGLSVVIEYSADSGQTWNLFCAFVWQGVTTPRKGTGNPGCVVDPTPLAGMRVRATITLLQATTIGFDLETL